VVRNGDQNLEVFVLSDHDEVWHVHQTPHERAGWSDWENRGGPVTSAVAGIANFDQRLQIFARFRDDGGIRHAYQRVAGGLWSGWEHPYGGAAASPPAVSQHTLGRLELFVLLNDARIYHAWQDNPGGQFNELRVFSDDDHSDEQFIGGPAVFSVAGCIHVFAPRRLGGVGFRKETAPEGPWTQWEMLPIRIGVAANTSLSCNIDNTGNIAFAASASDGQVSVTSWSNGTWRRTDLGGRATGTPTLARNSDGRLEVFVRSSDNTLQHRCEPWT
jgi:hypothetical protein